MIGYFFFTNRKNNTFFSKNTVKSLRSCILLPITFSTFNHCISNGNASQMAQYTIYIIIGYEPANLTVHPTPPPPQTIEGGYFFRIGV